MGELGRLIELYRDGLDPKPSDAWIGRKVGVGRSAVGPWLRGESMPKPEALRQLASLMGVAYRRVLDAALLDAGYLEEREYRGNAAPMNVVSEVGDPVPRSPGLGSASLPPRRGVGRRRDRS